MNIESAMKVAAVTMDEKSNLLLKPHLHIDFVPFTTGSKRGLETRISLKQALATQGFTGGTRKETEWNQWVQSEKEQLAAIMRPYGIEWRDMGNTEKHLDQLNFEKRERIKEVSEMEQKITVIAEGKSSMENEIGAIDDRLQHLQDQENLIGLNVDKYDKDSEWQLLEPGALISAKSYKTKIVDPYIKRLKDVVRSIVAQYLKMKDTVNDLRKELSSMKNRVWGLNDTVDNMRSENEKLSNIVTDYKLVRKLLGNEKTDSIVEQAKTDEHAAEQRPSRKIILKDRRKQHGKAHL